ncbi:hypothetical protein B9Z55_026446 [Caenorhabditis nigoni]|uniref:Uncharacterized protein n=1 Tax=Caenorhabditis nigoni TaxID=1611254 RepID=A0A2G5T3D7_9PELO|nr:hypothetical protein B9Z55_026446 [Caenorhabditis nigoni]
MVASLIMTCFSIFMVRHILFMKKHLRSASKSFKAETSLALTMISCLVPFVIDLIFAFVSFSRQAALGYILAVRPFALDFATVIFPIVFFMTHPIFRPKTTTAVVTSVNRIITFSES